MSDLTYLRAKARLRVAEAAKLFEVSQRTWRAWERGERPPQAAVLLYLQFITGDLTPLGMPGWCIQDGHLINPQGLTFTANDINAIPWHLQLIRAYQAELRTLEKYRTLNTASNETLADVRGDLTYEIDE